MTRIPISKEGGTIWVGNSMKAWEYINEAFLFGTAGDDIRFLSGSACMYAYDVVLGIRNPVVDPEFDFGRHFHYYSNKWIAMKKNYLGNSSVRLKKWKAILEEEVKKHKNKVYNVAFQFPNKHNNGKNCLLSIVFSRRHSEKVPTISVYLRASEVTKRLICDLLFFQRIGEYMYEDEKFQLVIHFNQLFNEDAVLLMYHTYKDVRELLSGNTSPRATKILELLDKFLNKNPEEIKYKVQRRSAKVLHPELMDYPKTLAKDCVL